MLKIKDNVDLKELEKFGFVKNEPIGYYTFDFCLCNTLFVRCDRILFLSNECSNIPNVVYDLIQAGLVEKVDQ